MRVRGERRVPSGGKEWTAETPLRIATSGPLANCLHDRRQQTEMNDNNRILDDFTVLDLSTFATEGFCSEMLANQGAKVVKVERPEIGDDNRHSGPPFIAGKSSTSGW